MKILAPCIFWEKCIFLKVHLVLLKVFVHFCYVQYHDAIGVSFFTSICSLARLKHRNKNVQQWTILCVAFRKQQVERKDSQIFPNVHGNLKIWKGEPKPRRNCGMLFIVSLAQRVDGLFFINNQWTHTSFLEISMTPTCFLNLKTQYLNNLSNLLICLGPS